MNAGSSLQNSVGAELGVSVPIVGEILGGSLGEADGDMLGAFLSEGD